MDTAVRDADDVCLTGPFKNNRGRMKAIIRVDKELCLGSRMCEIRAGALFAVTDDGLAEPVEEIVHSDDQINAAIDASYGCPTGAIMVDREQ